jgi:hypothetical protein
MDDFMTAVLEIHAERWLEERRERICNADPLGADAVLATLPQVNREKDVSWLAMHLSDICPTVDAIHRFTEEGCIAAMRDIGMLLGSLKQNGVEPLAVLPAVEPALRELGRRTEMIPRDTVHHYTEWNPTGVRQRMYTGDVQETVLIDAVRLALSHLEPAIELCMSLHELPVSDLMFATKLDTVSQHIEYFAGAMTTVVDGVKPEFFARTLRPYFEHIRVGGESYLGPAAAHVPLYIVDLVLWASDHASPQYRGFMQESIRHTLPRWRSVPPYLENKPSLVERIVAAMTRGADEAHTVAPAANALVHALRTLRLFRSKHLGMAQRAYRESIRLFPLGSGGGDVDLLRTIRDLVRENSELVLHSSAQQSGEH